jgi:hypothetical protein
MTDIYKYQYLKYYDNFILQLKMIFPSNETVPIIDNLLRSSDELKITKGQLFMSSISDENFDLFIKKKIKVFSHKNEETKNLSENLFGSDLPLKNLLNNQSDEVKEVIWSNLHCIGLISEALKPTELINQNKITTLKGLINKNSDLHNIESNKVPEPKQKLQELLGVDVNDQTTEMIEDIVQSFEKVLLGQSDNSNPLSGIMDISQNISVKYADKINNGEIELNKLMQAISKKVPGMEQMMGNMFNNSLTKQQKEKETIIMDENFSTADVQVGVNQETENKSIDFGGMLKMVDQFGIIPGGKQSNNETGIPGIGKVMELMQKLEQTETPADVEALKGEMDSFLQKELGVNVDELNNQLEAATKQLKENQ